MAENWWDAQKMFDLYLLDYMVKRNMHQTAAQFRAEGNIPQAEVVIDTEDGFLHEWWTIFYEMISSRERMSREAPPPPTFNAQPQRPMSEQEVRKMRLAQAFDVNQRRRLQALAMQSRGGTSSISGTTSAAGEMPIRTNYPMEYGRIFNEQQQRQRQQQQQQQLNNVMGPPVGNMLSNPLQPAHIRPRLHLPTSGSAAPSSSTPSYLKQKQPMQSPILPPLNGNHMQGIRIGNSSNKRDYGSSGGAALGRGGPGVVSTDAGIRIGNSSNKMDNGSNRGSALRIVGSEIVSTDAGIIIGKGSNKMDNGGNRGPALGIGGPGVVSTDAGIRIGNSRNKIDNGSNGGSALGRGGPEVVSTDAGTSGGMIPLPPEGWLMSFLQDVQKFHPGFLSEMEQQGQQKPPGQRAPHAEVAASAGPGTSVDSIMRDLDGNELTTGKGLEAENNDQDQDDEMMQQILQLEDPGESGVTRPEDQFIESFLSADGDQSGNEKGIRLVESHDEGQYSQATYHGVQEVRRLKASKNKMLCCHFSSNGKSLVTSGDEKEAWIWKTDDTSYERTSFGHSDLITDVRFRPNANVFATSSFDKTVQIWDAEKPSKTLYKLEGHGDQVLSLDFHPRQTELLCSCDRNDEIRFWNVNQGCLVKVSKGATTLVRFQPQSGKLLALASGNTVSIVDSETYAVQFTLKEHVKDVRSICWDSTGNYIASVSEESARVWSLAGGGKCTRKLMSHGRDFHSCTFHPRVSQALLVGGYENLVLWSVNQKWSTAAHKGIIAGMASSQATGLIASASHDGMVKLWK